jgi:tetratricopeptide (TPR) repeat protein
MTKKLHAHEDRIAQNFYSGLLQRRTIMKHRLPFVFGTIFLLSTTLFAQSAGELYQQGLVQENGVGNLQNAIQLYQRAAKASAGDRALAAMALLAAARCYEKLGEEESRKLYEEIEKSYPDQREQAAVAWERLSALRNQPSGKTLQDSNASPQLADISKQLADLERQQAFLASTYSPQHPQRQALIAQIADVSRALQMEAQRQRFVPLAPGIFASKRMDPDQPIKFTGTVSDVQWINPHVLVTVEVQESNGEQHSYRIKGVNPRALFGPGSAGYKTDILKAGDVVTVEGLRSRAEPYTIGFALFTLPDGSKFFAGASNFP